MTTTTGQPNTQRFAVGAQSELSVSNVSGKVQVNAVEGSEIIVTWTKRGSGRVFDNTTVDISQDGNRVSVQTRGTSVGLINFGRSGSIDYDIQVPHDCNVSVRGVSSDIHVAGVRNGAAIQTVSGNVSVQDIRGDVGLTTVSGDVRGGGLAGTLVARTTSGDGTLLHSNFRRFNLNTVSGDFTLETPLTAEEHSQAKTVSGDLTLVVPAATAATVQLKSVSGSVACDLPAEIIKSGRRHWQGRINGGGSQVDMNSVSGDLCIQKQGPASETQMRWKAGAGKSGVEVADIDMAAIVDSVHSVVGPIVDGIQPMVSSMKTMFDTREGAPEAPTAPYTATTDVKASSPKAPPAAEQVDTAAVLAALERGEITVDEAMEQLG
jgi:hypothetical protein